MRNNIDLVVDKLLKDGGKMNPDKIQAFAGVIEALKGEKRIIQSPNKIPNSPELTEDIPVDFSEIQGVELEGVKGSHRKISIVKTPEV